MAQVQSIAWQNDELQIIDQRQLPKNLVWLTLASAEECAQAIADMAVRGAQAIAIVAAYGVALSALAGRNGQALTADLALLSASRPTVAPLQLAMEALADLLAAGATSDEFLQYAHELQQKDQSNNLLMARLAADWIHKQSPGQLTLLTHGNTGALATGGHGTALGVVRTLAQEGLVDMVFVNETRPWLQGARLTTWELQQEGIPVTLNVDAAAAHIIERHGVSWVLLGADVIAANGDLASKIGSYNLALIARALGAKVMVVASSSVVDLDLATGADIALEERASSEVKSWANQSTAPEEVKAANPVVDLTPACWIDVLVTEKGLIEAPDAVQLNALLA